MAGIPGLTGGGPTPGPAPGIEAVMQALLQGGAPTGAQPQGMLPLLQGLPAAQGASAQMTPQLLQLLTMIGALSQGGGLPPGGGGGLPPGGGLPGGVPGLPPGF